jgi:hypothetical protein
LLVAQHRIITVQVSIRLYHPHKKRVRLPRPYTQLSPYHQENFSCVYRSRASTGLLTSKRNADQTIRVQRVGQSGQRFAYTRNPNSFHTEIELKDRQARQVSGTMGPQVRYPASMEEIMSRYLDTPPSACPPPADLDTHIRTNARVKGLLWTAAAGMAILIVFAIVITHAN